MTPERMAEIHARAMVHSRVWGVPTLQGFLAAPGAIVAAQENAFALGRVIVEEAELLTIAVSPEVQGKGLGRACLKAFEELAAAKGARRAFLEVSEANTSAVKFYLSENYTETGRRKAYYSLPTGRKSDALMMSKSLTAA